MRCTHQGRALPGEVAMRPVRIIAAFLFAATVAMLTPLAAPAWAASTTPPVVVRVSPGSVAAGDTVTVSGSAGPSAGSECAGGVADPRQSPPTGTPVRPSNRSTEWSPISLPPQEVVRHSVFYDCATFAVNAIIGRSLTALCSFSQDA